MPVNDRPSISKSGHLLFTEENPYEGVTEVGMGSRKKLHGRSQSNSALHRTFDKPEDFYVCTGVFTKQKEYMRFDTSSNGGQI